MVMMGWSLNLVTLFLCKLSPADNQYSAHICNWQQPFLNQWKWWMTKEKILWSVLTRKWCQTRALNQQPPDHQSGMNLTEPYCVRLRFISINCQQIYYAQDHHCSSLILLLLLFQHFLYCIVIICLDILWC